MEPSLVGLGIRPYYRWDHSDIWHDQREVGKSPCPSLESCRAHGSLIWRDIYLYLANASASGWGELLSRDLDLFPVATMNYCGCQPWARDLDIIIGLRGQTLARQIQRLSVFF